MSNTFRAAALVAAFLLGFVAPLRAQTDIAAPPGWSLQKRDGGARTFSPPDLQAGEVYSVTVYNSAAMDGKTLEEYLRAFAGPVGKKPGQLGAPLKIEARDGRIVSGTGVYGGPGGTALGVLFMGVSLDGGANIHMTRTLFSGQEGLLDRYAQVNQDVMSKVVARAKSEAGNDLHVTPGAARGKLASIGGKFVPGVYAGNQYHDGQLRQRFRVYLYPTGEYRLCDHNDQDVKKRFFDEQVGRYKYNPTTGQLDIDWTQALGFYSDDNWCYYGRGADGKPALYAEDNIGGQTTTLLVYAGPPTKRLSKSQAEEREAEIEAEKNRFKWVTAPGKGVPTAKIAAVLLHSKFNGQSADETVYLLLKDGTVYADLPVPPDTLDVIRSRQKEPDKWGKWRKTPAGYKVSWAGAPYQDLPGARVLPAPAQVKLNGRWGTGSSSGVIGFSSSYALWGVTFTRGGRFRKDSRGGSSSSIGFGDNATHVNSGYDDEGSFVGATSPGVVVASSSKKNNPNGNREGDYSINGYVLTLRYDNGKVARLPFFFLDAARKGLWFEGASMSRDDKK